MFAFIDLLNLIFLLSSKSKISENGVKFQSHIDGSYHFFTPEKVIEIQERKDARTRTNLEVLAERLNKLTLKFELQAGEDDKLFGSVTNVMIAEAIAEKGYTVDRKEIDMEETIKSLGNHYVVVKLGNGFSGRVKIKVSAKL